MLIEARLMLCLSVLDHRLAQRDQYEGAARAAYLELAHAEARAALDGKTIEQILESRAA
jgi:hypothetical protein